MPGAPAIDPLHVDLSFNSPMSDERAAGLVESLRPLGGAQVVDLGCGWAELLLRVVAANPTATGVGVDTNAAMIAHGRSTATARGLADRVELRVTDAVTWSGPPADVLLCIGATGAWGDLAAALAALRPLLRPGGRLVLGVEIWTRPPTPEALRALGIDADALGPLADLVAATTEAGFRPLVVSEASMVEWDSFESRYAAAWERWLLANPDALEVDQVRARADAHRNRWLRGYRGVLGFAYLTLGVP
jgi:cyclopropane fatty-acyl-phospholipid synthase-like methyltransferase